jgi:hypothetical protein
MSDYIGPNKKCARCGKRATGFATINDDRYCHGDNDPEPTCYMRGPVDKERDTLSDVPSPPLSDIIHNEENL